MWFALLAVAGVLAGDGPGPSGSSAREIGLDLSVNAQVAFAAFSTDDPAPSGAHDPQRTGFSIQTLELSFGQPVDPYFRLDGHLAVHSHGIEIEEVYATTLGLPARTQLRVGQFLTRFGRANALHAHQWDFVDQALVVGRFLGAEGNRGVGLEGSVLLPVPWFAELALSGTMAHGASTAPSFLGASDQPVRGPMDLQGTAVLEQFWSLSPDVGLLWGLSWATGPNSTGRDNRTELHGADLHLKIAPTGAGRFTEVVLQGEIVARRAQVPEALLSDWGFTSQLTWRFRPRWVLGGRFEHMSDAIDREGRVVPHPLDPHAGGARDRLAAALTFEATEFSRVRLQATRDAPGGRDPYHALFLQFDFGVGAHRAHAY